MAFTHLHHVHNPGDMKRTSRLFLSLISLLMTINGAFGQTASVTEGCAPLQVQFSPPAGFSTFFWDFKNGNNSTLQSPLATFASPGVYVVEFSPGQGQPVAGTVTVTVLPKPVVAFEADTLKGCRPLSVNFTNNSQVDPNVPVSGLNWVFGDGTASQEAAPTHLYNTSGNFTVSLQIRSDLAGCTSVSQISNYINVSSIDNAAFLTSPNPPLSCDPPLTVSFINLAAGPGRTYAWNFGNGNTSTAFNPPPQTYTTNGSYPVKLDITDVNGCTGSVTRTVTVGPPKANFAVPDSVCLGDTIRIANLSDAGLYSWTFEPNVRTLSVENEAAVVIFYERGPSDITLSVTSPDGNCTGDTTITIIVDKPDATFITDPTYSCNAPQEFNYNTLTPYPGAAHTWVFYNGDTSSEEAPGWTYEQGDNPYIQEGKKLLQTTLFLTSPIGCRDTFFRIDTVYTPYALFMPDRINGCAPLTVMFSDSSQSNEPILSYTYYYGDGNTGVFTTDAPHSYTFTQAGEYDVQLVIGNAAGCQDTSYVVTIEVGVPVTSDFTVDKDNICPGDTVLFTGLSTDPRIDAWHFEADDGRTSHCYQDPTMSWPFGSEPGAKDVTLFVEYNGCVDSLIKEGLITVRGPIARLEYEMDCADPYSYTFRDSSYEGSLITWDFGDGQTSNDPEVVHTYSARGDYTVILTVENPGTGCAPSRDTARICVREIKADFEIDERICAGTQVDLDGFSSQDVDTTCWKGYTWYFDISGRPITTRDSIIPFTFNNPGEETVSLVVEDVNGCRDTLERKTKIYTVSPDFTLDDQLVCFPATVRFTDLSTADTTLVSWQWDFGDGGTGMDRNPSHTYGVNTPIPPGTPITVTLKIEDAIGCPGEISRQINTYEPVSSIETIPVFPNNIQLCVGESVTFTAPDFTQQGSNLSFSWNFGNGQTANVQTATAIYNQAGTFQVNLQFEEIATGCRSSRTRQVDVQNYPVANFRIGEQDDTEVCTGQLNFFNASTSQVPLGFSWTSGDGQASTTANPIFSYNERGEYEMRLVVSTAYGCADTLVRDFTVVGPEGNFSLAPGRACLGDAVTFTLTDTSRVSSWRWDFGDGATATNTNPAQHTYDSPASVGDRTVALVLTDSQTGCELTVTNPIRIGNVIIEIQDQTICQGETAVLRIENPVQGSTYTWSPANLLLDLPTSANPRTAPLVTTTYNVTVVDAASGCTGTDSGTVAVVQPLDWAGQNITACIGDTVTFAEPPNPEGLYMFDWAPGGPEIIVQRGDSLFTLFVTDAAGCLNESYDYILNTLTGDYKIPNIFTPNGDKSNDVFRIFTDLDTDNPAEIEIHSVRVYSRWGQLVFEGQGNNAEWDGNYKGEPAPSDVYIYYVEFTNKACGEDTRIVEKGDVTLLR